MVELGPSTTTSTSREPQAGEASEQDALTLPDAEQQMQLDGYRSDRSPGPHDQRELDGDLSVSFPVFFESSKSFVFSSRAPAAVEASAAPAFVAPGLMQIAGGDSHMTEGTTCI